MTGRLLTFNCHEAWVHQLGALGLPLDVVDGLPGRYTARWDERMRPVPAAARLITLDEARAGAEPYQCIIGHNLSDLLAVRELDAPRLLVLHVTLEHRVQQARLETAPKDLVLTMRRYLELAGGHVIAVTEGKKRSWGLEADVVESFADPADYLPWTGEIAEGLRIANQIDTRRQYLAWSFHEQAFRDVPVRIVGHNPGMTGVAAASSWLELKRMLAAHRFFVHTADAGLEDGFNMALIEALAAGLPIVGNRHPTSPIEDGVEGFLCDTPAEAAARARALVADAALARRMGEAAQALARRRFTRARFVAGMHAAIATARERWQARPRQPH